MEPIDLKARQAQPFDMTAGAKRIVLEALNIIESREVEGHVYETCASATAEYIEDSSELRITLDAFVRRFEMRGKDFRFRPEWLPRKDVVVMHAGPEEAGAASKDVFHSWAKRVKAAVPSVGEWKRCADSLDDKG
jgi:hypothetical protein